MRAWLLTASDCRPHPFLIAQEGGGGGGARNSSSRSTTLFFVRASNVMHSAQGKLLVHMHVILDEQLSRARQGESKKMAWLDLADEQSRPTASQQFMSVQSTSVMERTSGHYPSGGDRHGLKAESGARCAMLVANVTEHRRTDMGSLALQRRLEQNKANMETVEDSDMGIA